VRLPFELRRRRAIALPQLLYDVPLSPASLVRELPWRRSQRGPLGFYHGLLELLLVLEALNPAFVVCELNHLFNHADQLLNPLVVKFLRRV